MRSATARGMRLCLATLAAGGVWFVVVGGRPIEISSSVLTGFGAAAIAVLVALLAGWGAAAGVFVAALAPSIRKRFRQRRAAAVSTEAWPEFLAVLRGRIAAGESLPDAVRNSAHAVGGPFSDLDRPWSGEFELELRRLQAQWADSIADRVFTTLRIAATTGGSHVDEILASLTLALSEELRLRSAHESAVAQQQMTAGVSLLAPWVILALSVATNPQASEVFSSAAGHRVVASGAVATGLGYWLARRTARLDRPPRVFA